MDGIKSRITAYLDELRKWNKKINLISEKDLPDVEDRHYQDSIAVLELIPPNAHLLDMGSGNGFPSIPIAIHRPDVSVVAVEIKKKKALFLENVSRRLNLNNYALMNISIDDHQPHMEAAFDVVTSRAFKDLATILEKAYYFSRNNAHVLYYNSLSNNQIDHIKPSLKKVIHNVNNLVYNLKNGETRSIIDITLNKVL